MTQGQRATLDRLKQVVTDEQNRINRGQSALIKAEDANSDDEIDRLLREAQLALE